LITGIQTSGRHKTRGPAPSSRGYPSPCHTRAWYGKDEGTRPPPDPPSPKGNGKPHPTGSEDFPLFIYEVRELQQYHRTLISHLFVLLPILFLTHWQTPYQTEIGRVGSRLLISLLCLRHSSEWDMPAWIHAQYFGNLWTVPVQGRNTPTSLLAVDWADTLSIWIYPSGALSTRLGNLEEEEGAELTAAEFQHKYSWHDDEESQRQGLMLLQRPSHLPHLRSFPPTSGRST